MQKFINKNWKIIERQKVECYTRVMWYLRPVGCFNLWKKSEFYSRMYFNKLKAANMKFISDYN
jgi:ABC-type polysaccharide transport system permease subunit